MLLKTKQKKFSRDNSVYQKIKKLEERIVDIRKKNAKRKSDKVKKWKKSEKMRACRNKKNYT